MNSDEASLFIKKRVENNPTQKEASGLFSNHNYDLLNKKRNLNLSKLKPSVTPSSSVNLDSYTRRKLVSNLSTHSTSIEFDADLQASLISRLKTLEGQVLNYKHQLLMKDTQVKELASKVSEDAAEKQKLRDSLKEAIQLLDRSRVRHNFDVLKTPDSTNVDTMISTPTQAPLEINFPSSRPQSSQSSQSSQEESNDHPRLNMNVVMAKISALNRLVSEDSYSVSSYSNVNQFKSSAKVRICFYKNGVTVDDGPFRPYQWDITKALLNDICDGYFPYEFKEKYPDGVQIEGIDRTDNLFTKTTEISKKLEKYDKDNKNVKDLAYLKLISEDDTNTISREDYLNQLPKNVIKDGKIIPIRSEIGEILGIKDQEDISIETECDRDMESSEPHIGKRRVAQLKIRCPSTNQNFSLNMHPTDTIVQLRKLLKPYLKTEKFELKTTYPPRSYSDPMETLEEAKLTPKATMFVFVEK